MGGPGPERHVVVSFARPAGLTWFLGLDACLLLEPDRDVWIFFVGLALAVVPACLVFAGRIGWSTHAALMLVGAVLWFASAPFWMSDEAS